MATSNGFFVTPAQPSRSPFFANAAQSPAPAASTPSNPYDALFAPQQQSPGAASPSVAPAPVPAASGNPYGSLFTPVDTTPTVSPANSLIPWLGIPAPSKTQAGLAAGAALAQHYTALPSKVRNAIVNAKNTNAGLSAAQEAHAANLSALSNAQAEFDALTSPNAHAPFMQYPTLVQGQGVDPLTMPRGGTGTANHVVAFGGSPQQAHMATSMSEGQQRIVPLNDKVWAAADSTVGSANPLQPLNVPSQIVTGQEGQQAILDDIAQAKAKIAPAQAVAGAKLTAAKTAAAQTESLLQQANADAAQTRSALTAGNGALNPAQQRIAAAVAADSGSVLPDVIRGAGRLLGRIAVPAAVAAVPGEAINAWNSAKAGNYGPAVTSGMGAVGGTLLGAGALAAALGAAPEMAAGLGTMGAVTGAAPLAQSAADWIGNKTGLWAPSYETPSGGLPATR